MGDPKPQSAYRRVLWGVDTMRMLVHRPAAHPELPAKWKPQTFNWAWPDEVESWTWPGFEGQPLGVRVFARGCESVQLALDGKTLATAAVQSNLTAIFTGIPYRSGSLQASCVNGSTPVRNISYELQTAGAPASLQLHADRTVLRHNMNDLAYVSVTVVDAVSRRHPTAAVSVSFSVGGAGRLVAVGSGDPADPSSFTDNARTTWRGRAMAILQPTLGVAAGTITLTASVPGLKAAQITITTIIL